MNRQRITHSDNNQKRQICKETLLYSIDIIEMLYKVFSRNYNSLEDTKTYRKPKRRQKNVENDENE